MVKFKDFKIKDLFDIHTGKDLGMLNLVKGSYNVVSNSLSNNGISATTKFIEGRHLFDYKKCIAIIDIGGFGAKVQTQDFYVTARVKVVELKNTIGVNKNVLLYFATLIDQYRLMFDSYSSNATNKLKDLFISVPVTTEGTPDYAYMEDYIKGIQRQYIDNLLETNEAERNRLLSIVGLSLDEYERVKGNIELEDAESYGEFKVGDLFEIESISQIPRGYNVDLTGVGHPYISQSSENKGIKGYTEDSVLPLNKKNAIVLGVDTISQGVINWIDEDFYANKMLALRSSKLNNHNAPYIITMILKKSMVYDYNNKVSKAKLLEMTIKLPTTSTGEVDYQYMEDYISKIKLIYIYNRELSVNEQVRLLESLIADKELVETT